LGSYACGARTGIENRFKEALKNSEILQHMGVLPFSVTDKLLKMKNKSKLHFDLFLL